MSKRTMVCIGGVNKMFNLVGAVLIVIVGCLSVVLAITLISLLVDMVGGVFIVMIIAFLACCVYIAYRWLERLDE